MGNDELSVVLFLLGAGFGSAVTALLLVRWAWRAVGDGEVGAVGGSKS